LLTLILLSACENDDIRLGDLAPAPLPGQAVSLQNHVQPIFDANCAFPGCHGGSSPQMGMSLEAGRIFTDVVGIPSIQAPALLRIEPGRSDRSYVIHKIEGTQVQADGSGQQMPPGGPYLSAEQIQLIREWIDQGALDN
jgi:hypothetical protein